MEEMVDDIYHSQLGCGTSDRVSLYPAEKALVFELCLDKHNCQMLERTLNRKVEREMQKVDELYKRLFFPALRGPLII